MGCPCHHTARGVTLMCSLTSRHKGERATPPPRPPGAALYSYFKVDHFLKTPRASCQRKRPFMDGDRTKEAELRAPGGGKRTLREATKGTPPKPEPSRSRNDNSESMQPLGSVSEAVAGEPPRNSRCALYPAHVQLFE